MIRNVVAGTSLWFDKNAVLGWGISGNLYVSYGNFLYYGVKFKKEKKLNFSCFNETKSLVLQNKIIDQIENNGSNLR